MSILPRAIKQVAWRLDEGQSGRTAEKRKARPGRTGTTSRKLILFALAVMLAGCSPKPEAKWRLGDWSGLSKQPMDVVVARLAEASESWLNGVVIPIALPENARPEDVLEKVFVGRRFERGKLSEYRILEERDVKFPNGIPPGIFKVLKVQTNLGDMVVLLQPTPRHNWWSRVIEG